MGTYETEYCPLCHKNNHCCNSKDKSLGVCWCSKEVFPKEIFELVPADQLRKTCICKNCLEKFKAKEFLIESERIHTMIELNNFSIGLPKKMKYGNDEEMDTGICKETIEEAFLTKDGFRGDGVADLRFHGGPDRAVCVYPQEHYSLWEREFQSTLPRSAFGENLTVTNMREQEVHIGDIFRLGDAIIQIAQGRIPCSTITKRTGMASLLTRIVETGFTGYLCRVLEEGTVRSDSKITLLESDPGQVSILFANQIYFHNPKDIQGIQKILGVQALAGEWQDRLGKRLEKLINVNP